MAGFRQYVLGFVILILFTFCLFGFVLNFIAVKNLNHPILNNTYHLSSSMTNLNETLNSFTANTNESVASFNASEAEATDFLFLIFKGAFYIPKLFLSVILGGGQMLLTILLPSLNGTGLGSIISIVFTLIGGGIIVTFIFLAIKNIRTGESER